MLADIGHWGHTSMPVLVCQSKKQQWPLLCMYVQGKGFHVSMHGKGRFSEFARSVGKESRTSMICSGRLESRAAMTVQPIHKPSDSRCFGVWTRSMDHEQAEASSDLPRGWAEEP